VINREQATAIVAKRQRGRLLIVADRANDDITMHTPLREDRAHGPDTRDCRIARRNGTGTASRLAGYRFSSVGEARRREPAVVCQQPPVVRSAQFDDGRQSTTTQSTRLPQPWHCDSAARSPRVMLLSPLRSPGTRPTGRSLSLKALVRSGRL
jgi:hypothetical protein